MRFRIIFEDTLRLWTWYLEDEQKRVIVRPTHKGLSDKTAILNEIRRIKLSHSAPILDDTPKVMPPPGKMLHRELSGRNIDEGFRY